MGDENKQDEKKPFELPVAVYGAVAIVLVVLTVLMVLATRMNPLFDMPTDLGLLVCMKIAGGMGALLALVLMNLALGNKLHLFLIAATPLCLAIVAGGVAMDIYRRADVYPSNAVRYDKDNVAFATLIDVVEKSDDAPVIDDGGGYKSSGPDIGEPPSEDEIKEAVEELTALGEIAAVTGGDAAAGATKFAACAACHGPDGQGIHKNGEVLMEAPRLTGIDPWYLKVSLEKYASKKRGYDPAKDPRGSAMPAMAGMVAADADKVNLIAFIKSKPHEKNADTVGGDVAAGKAIFDATCAACHGANAAGNGKLRAPGLRALPDWYVVNQLGKFQNGARGAAEGDVEGAIMAKMAGGLDKKAMKDLASYILTLQE
jgi:cytochrome c553